MAESRDLVPTSTGVRHKTRTPVLVMPSADSSPGHQGMTIYENLSQDT